MPEPGRNHCDRYVLQMHESSARVPGVMKPDMADAGGFDHSRPSRRQGVRTECSACLIYNHVSASFVVLAERQTVGGLDGPGGPQCGDQMVRDRKRSPSRSRLRSLLNEVPSEPKPCPTRSVAFVLPDRRHSTGGRLPHRDVVRSARADQAATSTTPRRSAQSRRIALPPHRQDPQGVVAASLGSYYMLGLLTAVLRDQMRQGHVGLRNVAELVPRPYSRQITETLPDTFTPAELQKVPSITSTATATQSRGSSR